MQYINLRGLINVKAIFVKKFTGIGCLNVHGTQVTGNNTTNDNIVFFFFVSDLRIVEQLLIFDHKVLD